MSSNYGVEGAALTKRREIDDEHAITFRAEGIRQERTGVHGRVTVVCNGAVLAWSNFNVEKDEDRVRLANSAYTHLNGLSVVYPKTHLKNDLDQFCAGLWDAQIGQMMPAPMAGSHERTGPSFLLRPYLLKGGGTILFAPPGRGKSYSLLLMAVSVDAGLSELWPVQHGRALFVNLERSAESVQQRLGNVNGALGLERERPIDTVNARGRSLMDVAAACERFIGERGTTCIFVDSISRAGGGTLVADDTTNRICDQLNRFEIAWLGLGHTPRQDESHVYGSVFWEAAADLCVQLLSEQEEGGPLGIGLQLTKKNDVGSTSMWIGALEFDDLGLTQVRRARPGEFLTIEMAKKKSAREQVREHLSQIGPQTEEQIARELEIPVRLVRDVVRSDPGMFTPSAGALNGRRLYAVANDLPF